MCTRVCHAHAVSQTHISNTRSHDVDADVGQTQFKSRNQIKMLDVLVYYFVRMDEIATGICKKMNEMVTNDKGE